MAQVLDVLVGGEKFPVSSPEGDVSRSVVGVVGQVKCQGLGEATGAQIYVPYSQDPASVLYLALRTDSNPEEIARAVRVRVSGLDSNLPCRRRFDHGTAIIESY